ncbi:MAG: HEAT repeat domain-containing protein [Candidatus Heimdallarchaeaceae archaeon]
MSYKPDLRAKDVFDKKWVQFLVALFLIFIAGYVMGLNIKWLSSYITIFEFVSIIVSLVLSVVFTILLFTVFIFFLILRSFQEELDSYTKDENIDKLIELLDKKFFKSQVIDSISKLGVKAKKAEPFLLRELENKKSNIREATCYTLGEIKSKKAINDFVKLKEFDENIDVRIAAIRALNNFSSEFKTHLSKIIDLVKLTTNWNNQIKLVRTLCLLQIDEIKPFIDSELKIKTNAKHIFDLNYCLVLIDGIKSPSMQIIDELYSEGKIGFERKHAYKNHCRIIIFKELEKKRRRKSKPDDENILAFRDDVTKEMSLFREEMKTIIKNQKRNTWLKILIPIILTGIFSIIIALLYIYL